MKEKILALSLVLIIGISLSACSEQKVDTQLSDTPSVSEEISEEKAEVGVVNPIVEVENSQALRDSLGINMDAPTDAKDIVYMVISDEIAQIIYTLNEKEFVLRASKTIAGVDLSGMHGDFELIEYTSANITADVIELENGSALAVSTVEAINGDKIHISLSTDNEITGDEIYSLIDEIGSKIVAE